MHWLLIALLLAPVLLVLQSFWQKITRSKAKRRGYEPPSAALIDKALPEEIFEHVLSFSDPLSLVRCHFVNKYWDYQASKQRIQEVVLRYELNKVKDLLRVKDLSVASDQWLEYSADYPIQRRLTDFARAQKRNKLLIELKHAPHALKKERKAFMLKTRGTLRRSTDQNNELNIMQCGHAQDRTRNVAVGTITFRDAQDFKAATGAELPGPEANEYEMIVPLGHVVYLARANHSEVLMCRQLTRVKYFLGVIPHDAQMSQNLFFVLLPVLVHDLSYYGWFMNIFHQWFALFGTAAGLFLAWLVLLSTSDIFRPTSVFFSAIGFVRLYPHSATHFGFIAVVVAAYLYGFEVFFHFWEFKILEGRGRARRCEIIQFKNRNLTALFASIVALVLLTVDYTNVYTSILDRRLFYQLFWNTVQWAIFSAHCVATGVLASIGSRAGFNWTQMKWNITQNVNLLIGVYSATVFATLYAPYWEYSHVN